MSNSDFRYRLPREEPTEIEDDTAHLWAISYADFLMVLLSFFILFFSISDDERDNLIKYLAKTPWPEAQQSSSTTSSGDNQTHLKDIIADLSDLDIVVSNTDDNELILKFPDRMYQPGSTTLLVDGTDLLVTSLNRLKDYWPKLEFTFIGHVDKMPLLKNKNQVIENNYDLSALRASKALQIALKMGIPSENLVSEGWGSQRYNSRSLSVKIKISKYVARVPANNAETTNKKVVPQKRKFNSYPVKSY